MRAKRPLLATVLAVGIGYVAYPYVTLYRLGSAIHGGDPATLEALVDWPSVREGIKEDICDLVADEPNLPGGARLPPFGASFMRGIASSTIDQKVTPQAILAATSTSMEPNGFEQTRTIRKQDAPQQGADVHIGWAFFDSPTRFSVSLRTQGLAEPIRLEMELHQGEWQVRRVWLPDALLGSAPART